MPAATIWAAGVPIRSNSTSVSLLHILCMTVARLKDEWPPREGQKMMCKAGEGDDVWHSHTLTWARRVTTDTLNCSHGNRL